MLALDSQILEISKQLYSENSLLIMGRGFNYATCLEGALKVKELTYMHSEGILAGELKHGPLAMVDPSMAIIMLAMDDPVKSKILNAYQQVSARGGKPLLICNEDDKDIISLGAQTIKIPKTVDCLQGILSVIPLQMLSFHIAVLKGYDVSLNFFVEFCFVIGVGIYRENKDDIKTYSIKRDFISLKRLLIKKFKIFHPKILK